MIPLLRASIVLLALCCLAACQITGAAPPASRQTTGINALGGPGSGAP